jgi:hypothetical protein
MGRLPMKNSIWAIAENYERKKWEMTSKQSTYSQSVSFALKLLGQCAFREHGFHVQDHGT